MRCTILFNDTATTKIYTLSLHDALPISGDPGSHGHMRWLPKEHVLLEHYLIVGHGSRGLTLPPIVSEDRKSTRLNSSHANISHVDFCLKHKSILGLNLPKQPSLIDADQK